MKVIGRSKRGFIKPKPKAKVYCCKCRYYKAGPGDNMMSVDWCTHPEVTETTDTPVRVVHTYGDCNILNLYNECKKFKAIS